MFLKVKDGNNWVEIPMIKGDTGATGPAGQDGQDGQDGADGVGVPSGGTQGQVLTKSSSTDYDTAWATPSSELPSYSSSQNGQVLGVTSGALAWTTPVTMTDVQNYVNSLDGTNISY